ncbi:MAG: 30S ribosomal protein S4 [Candidatus Yanofskybacteria bacterium]|nr:30S ribosomal protein S4 [Candidatus Yanofskybacteria bacterium]
MARYRGPKEKIERRIGVKLFLKGERSFSPKSAMVKKPYPPGMHGKSKFRKLSEYGSQLNSKQKVKHTYRLLEKQFKSYVKEAIKSKKETGNLLVGRLERRLDNVVYKMGLAQSRDQARQLVNHGHILVNGTKNNIPSYGVMKGDKVSVREGSKKTKYFSALVPNWLPKHENPSWISLDKNSLTATIEKTPEISDSGLELNDIQSIIEFYSR